MQFETREIHTNQIGRTISGQILLDEDFNVPDSKRDVKRIVAASGSVRAGELKPVEAYIRMAGTMEFQVLYADEGMEPTLCTLEGKLPFEEMIYCEEQDGTYDIKNLRVKVHATLIHSRKLRIKAMIEWELESEQERIEEFPMDVDSSASLYKKRKQVELLKLYAAKKDTYRIKEEVGLSGTKETIGTMLWTDIVNRKLDTKLVGDELQLDGELFLFCFYESPDGKIDWLEQAVPYHGHIECLGADETMYHQVQAHLDEVEAEVRMDEDGEMRLIGVEGTIKLSIAIYEEEQMDVLQDVYSLERQCKLEQKEVCYEQLILQNHSKCKIAQRLSLPELNGDILQICHTSGIVQVDEMRKIEQGVQVEGVLHIRFLYVKANDEVPFDTWEGMVPFSYLIECTETDESVRFHICSMLEQLSVTLLGGDEVEIKAVLAFHSFFRKCICVELPVDLTMEAFDLREMEKRPSVIGYVVKEGDELWGLAKRYSTTEQSICEVNELADNQLKVGDRILIFKENMSIL